MHVLIIPSEEFIPPESHLAGIFQLHQAKVLTRRGHKVGALSIKQVYSIPMLLKGALQRMLGMKGSAKLPLGNAFHLIQILMQRVFVPEESVTEDVVNSIPVTRIEGVYYCWPSLRFDYLGWVAAGKIAFEAYIRKHGRPDVLHAHNALYAGLVARSVSRSSGIPYMITEHSSYLARLRYPKPILRRAGLAIADAGSFATVSESLGRQLTEGLGSCASGWTWIPNVVDPKIEEAPLCEITPSTAIRFLAIGSLIPIKDHATLIRALAIARSKNP